MLVPNAVVLQEALNRYRALSDSEHRDDPDLRRELQDAVYTLCVLTGTRTLDSARTAAETMCHTAAGRGGGRPPLRRAGRTQPSNGDRAPLPTALPGPAIVGASTAGDRPDPQGRSHRLPLLGVDTLRYGRGEGGQQ
jgi:hypothetical protein